jgi:hypothetical protein
MKKRLPLLLIFIGMIGCAKAQLLPSFGGSRTGTTGNAIQSTSRQ